MPRGESATDLGVSSHQKSQRPQHSGPHLLDICHPEIKIWLFLHPGSAEQFCNSSGKTQINAGNNPKGNRNQGINNSHHDLLNMSNFRRFRAQDSSEKATSLHMLMVRLTPSDLEIECCGSALKHANKGPIHGSLLTIHSSRC